MTQTSGTAEPVPPHTCLGGWCVTLGEDGGCQKYIHKNALDPILGDEC